MINKENVIKIIDELISEAQKEPAWKTENALRCLKKELLKEQEVVEPKQVIRKQCKTEHPDGSIDYFAEWYCPHCNSLIVRGFDNPSIKFCYKCGKPILWEGR